MGQKSIKSCFFARRAKKALAGGRSPPQELEEGPRSGPYLLLYFKESVHCVRTCSQANCMSIDLDLEDESNTTYLGRKNRGKPDGGTDQLPTNQGRTNELFQNFDFNFSKPTLAGLIQQLFASFRVFLFFCLKVTI